MLFLATVVLFIFVFVWTFIKWMDAREALKEARRLLEENRTAQISLYGKDFQEWHKEFND